MEAKKESEYSWTIEQSGTENLVKVFVKGAFSQSGHSEMIADVVSREFWEKGRSLLIDDRKVEFKNTDVEMVKNVSENFKSFESEIGNSKVAILMDSLIDYARGRQFELLTDIRMSARISIYMNEEKAVEWLTT